MKRLLLLLAASVLWFPISAGALQEPWDEIDYDLLRQQGILLDRAENSNYSSTRKLTPEDVVYLTLRTMDALGDGDSWQEQARSGAEQYTDAVPFDETIMTKESYAFFWMRLSLRLGGVLT